MEITEREQQEKIPKATLKMAQFIGAIIRSATIAFKPARQTAIPCRKDTGRNKCSGFIKVLRQDIPTPQINWSCNRCDENGSVSGWKESHYNLSEFSQPPSDIVDGHCLILTRHEYQALLDAYILEPSFEAMLLDAVPLVGGIQITISEQDLEFFMETLAPVCNYEKNKRVGLLLDSVYGKFLDLSDQLFDQEAH